MPPMDGMPPMPGMPPMDGMPPMPGMPPMDMPQMPDAQVLPKHPAPQETKETEIIAEKKEGAPARPKTEEELYNEFMELMSKSKYQNPLEDPEIQKMMMKNARPEEIEQIKQAQQMFDPKFIELAKSKEKEFMDALPQE